MYVLCCLRCDSAKETNLYGSCAEGYLWKRVQYSPSAKEGTADILKTLVSGDKCVERHFKMQGTSFITYQKRRLAVSSPRVALRQKPSETSTSRHAPSK